MNSVVKCLVAFVVFLGSGVIHSQTIDEYIKKANNLKKSGELNQAIMVMSEATKKYPDNALAYSYLGLYTGMKAGKTKDFMEAGRIIIKSYEMLDKAVSLDSNNPIHRFHRGLMSVNIPEFLGKLDMGIKDLEILIKISKESPQRVSKDILLRGYNYLALGYKKKGNKQKAIEALKMVVGLSPGTDMAKKAEENIVKFSKAKQAQKIKKRKPDSAKITGLKQRVKNKPKSPLRLIELGKAYIGDKNFKDARKILKKAIELDSKNIKAYKLLVFVISELASKGYDEKIYENTDYRSNLAFEYSETIDRACAITPDDYELRLLKGISGVEMPFFVEKLDQAIVNLNWLLKSNAPDSTKAEAFFWLGRAYQKKSMTYWIKVVSKYSKSKASQYVFDRLRPSVKRIDLSKYKTPILIIDFILGFKDELPPQTAVWIESKDGAFLKTIYVSGFSGFAKEQQINLPKWSKSSNFSDVDGVTGASINLGHHIYVWDLKNDSGNRVKPGEYVIKVEVHYWPSMEYQIVTAAIKVGKRRERIVTEKGKLIPYLELKYYPSK